MLRGFPRSVICASIAIMAPSSPAYAAGDLLVAPTRLALADTGSGEVLLSNKGAETATYRISTVLKRMQPDGQFEDIAVTTPEQQSLTDMISYAPRRVVLGPGQTQTVRVGVRMPPGMAEGEYRVHLLFRAVPTPGQAVDIAAQTGVSIALTPVYGVTIPVIVRKGALDAGIAIENARLSRSDGQGAISLDLVRNGNRSVYGSIKLFKAGTPEPVVLLRGIALYTELDRRTVTIGLTQADMTKLTGPVTLRFDEEGDVPVKLSAEAKINLP